MGLKFECSQPSSSADPGRTPSDPAFGTDLTCCPLQPGSIPAEFNFVVILYMQARVELLFGKKCEVKAIATFWRLDVDSAGGLVRSTWTQKTWGFECIVVYLIAASIDGCREFLRQSTNVTLV